MNAVTFTQFPNRTTVMEESRSTPPRLWESRLPRRTVRQVIGVPLSDDKPRVSGRDVSYRADLKPQGARPRIEVAAIPSSDRNCRHHLFVEDGNRLKKINLPAAACVTVTQPFTARTGDTLTYDYVVVLNARGEFTSDRPAVRAVLVNRKTDTAVSLMDRSLANCNVSDRRTSTRFRESQTFTVPTGGDYELRFITFVDHSRPGSEAHLLVSSIRVVNPSGQEVKRLASLSCVGRVYQPTIRDSMN